MVKPPAVYLAGMLRTLGDRISTEQYPSVHRYSASSRPSGDQFATRLVAGAIRRAAPPRDGTARTTSPPSAATCAVNTIVRESGLHRTTALTTDP